MASSTIPVARTTDAIWVTEWWKNATISNVFTTTAAATIRLIHGFPAAIPENSSRCTSANTVPMPANSHSAGPSRA